MTDNPLWDLIQKYMDDPKHRYPPKPADLARETGISEQVLSKWRTKNVIPNPQLMLAFSAGTGIPYADLLTAALRGRGYLGLSLVVSSTIPNRQVLQELLDGDFGLEQIEWVRERFKETADVVQDWDGSSLGHAGTARGIDDEDMSRAIAKPDLQLAARRGRKTPNLAKEAQDRVGEESQDD